MQEAFGIVLFAVVVVGVVVAVISFIGSGELYRQIGRGGLSLNEDDETRPAAAGPAPAAATGPERDAEIRQMLAARNARRVRRGEAPVDVEAELTKLTAGPSPDADPGLRAEVRQLVVARNARRVRAGKQPLDVDAEVERQLRELT